MDPRPELIIQKDESLFPEVVFALPQNPLHRPLVSIWSGRPARLSVTSQLQQILEGFAWPTTLVLKASLAAQLPPGLPVLRYETTKNNKIGQTDLIISTLLDQNLVVLGPDLEMNSGEQVLAEKLLTQLPGKVIITADLFRIFLTNHALYESSAITIFASTPELIKLADNLKIGLSITPKQGIYNKLDLLQRLSLGKKKFIVYDSDQVIAYDSQERAVAGVYNSAVELSQHRAVLLGLCSGFLAVESSQKTHLKNVLTACFIQNKLTPSLINSREISSKDIKKMLNEISS